jgi:hypothetical protein
MRHSKIYGAITVVRKKRKSKKEFPKHPDFADRNLSPIESLTKKGNLLKSPFSALPVNITMNSWSVWCVPNILWASILTSCLERDDYLDIFRKIVMKTREKVENRKQLFVTHNFLATATDEEFDTMMGTVLAHDRAPRFLSALKLVDCLPDRAHWNRHLGEPDPEKDWQVLAHAVGDTYDHQSERSTDIRWLKLMFTVICQENLMLPAENDDLVDALRLYPNQGDLRSVNPSIRALEMTLRMDEFGETEESRSEGAVGREPPPLHIEAFWREMKDKWPCLLSGDVETPSPGPGELIDELLTIFQKLETHFHDTLKSTAPDSRHDGAFGLTLYGLTFLMNAAHGYASVRPEGRVMLRTIAETFITLHYLNVKDDLALWGQYRRYGSGQAKLTFLKNVREADTPEYLDLHMLEHLANEDMWMEFEDINLGSWGKSNLRSMAETSGVKDVYDKYYDWTSGYAHGQWISVRDTVFTNCLNSLHRFHRVPSLPKSSMPTVLGDGCRLVNRMLEDLNHLYPTFKGRIKWHNLRESDSPGNAKEPDLE